MGPVAAMLPCGERLHLQHGPIDLVIGAEGARKAAFEAARARFDTVLDELVGELHALRIPASAGWVMPRGETARRMHLAARSFADGVYLTRMAGVAGAVAETVLAAMVEKAEPRRAYVNNGGDIALHLTPGTRFTIAVQSHDEQGLSEVVINAEDPIRGVATSGRHGRSQSLGIADSVTVLAKSAAQADVAATLIANAVDLPGHRAITRAQADMMRNDSDLGALLVVTACGALSEAEKQKALARGAERARTYLADHRILSAALFLQAASCTLGVGQHKKVLEHA